MLTPQLAGAKWNDAALRKSLNHTTAYHPELARDDYVRGYITAEEFELALYKWFGTHGRPFSTR